MCAFPSGQFDRDGDVRDEGATVVVLMFGIVIFALCAALFLAIAARGGGAGRTLREAQVSRLDRMDGVRADTRRAYHGRHSAHTPRHVA
jgi:hypothetical protein